MDLQRIEDGADRFAQDRPIEVLAKDVRYEPLPPEVRTAVIAAWTRGGLLPEAAIEQMVPERTGMSLGPVCNSRNRNRSKCRQDCCAGSHNIRPQ
jgi:hypothetical protein